MAPALLAVPTPQTSAIQRAADFDRAVSALADEVIARFPEGRESLEIGIRVQCCRLIDECTHGLRTELDQRERVAQLRHEDKAQAYFEVQAIKDKQHQVELQRLRASRLQSLERVVTQQRAMAHTDIARIVVLLWRSVACGRLGGKALAAAAEAKRAATAAAEVKAELSGASRRERSQENAPPGNRENPPPGNRENLVRTPGLKLIEPPSVAAQACAASATFGEKHTSLASLQEPVACPQPPYQGSPSLAPLGDVSSRHGQVQAPSAARHVDPPSVGAAAALVRSGAGAGSPDLPRRPAAAGRAAVGDQSSNALWPPPRSRSVQAAQRSPHSHAFLQDVADPSSPPQPPCHALQVPASAPPARVPLQRSASYGSSSNVGALGAAVQPPTAVQAPVPTRTLSAAFLQRPPSARVMSPPRSPPVPRAMPSPRQHHGQMGRHTSCSPQQGRPGAAVPVQVSSTSQWPSRGSYQAPMHVPPPWAAAVPVLVPPTDAGPAHHLPHARVLRAA